MAIQRAGSRGGARLKIKSKTPLPANATSGKPKPGKAAKNPLEAAKNPVETKKNQFEALRRDESPAEKTKEKKDEKPRIDAKENEKPRMNGGVVDDDEKKREDGTTISAKRKGNEEKNG